MKRFLWILVLILFISPVLAKDTSNNDSNWGIQPLPSPRQTFGEDSEKVLDVEKSQNVYENYGSQDSPYFLNRENIDPSTSNFEDKYDYEDDEPCNYEAGSN